MIVPTLARSLEERRQALIQDAQDQIERLQAMDLTKRHLAEVAMEICGRNVAIHQLNAEISWFNY